MASPFSFHCMICVEEFDHTLRFPVVLPCGHTYVCNQCAEKLDKCMECRTPLTIPGSKAPPQAMNHLANNVHQRSTWASARSGGRLVSSASAERLATAGMSAPKRLPLPKNVVLLSLMEATEIATENGQEEDAPILAGSEDEDEKIRVGTSLAVGACGTYVVVAGDGLQIFPSRPAMKGSSPTRRRSSSQPTDEDVDTLVRFFHLDHKMDLKLPSTPEQKPRSPPKELPPVQLSRGDRIQIVAVEDGWAKLARGYGYVRSGGKNIAKVGGSVDKACGMEAMLRALSTRRKELRLEQGRIDSQFVKLMGELQSSLMNDEDLTVIGADTFSGVDHENLIHDNTDEGDENSDKSLNTSRQDLEEIFKPHRLEREETPPILQTTALACFSPEVLGPLFIGNSPSSMLRGIRQSLSFTADTNNVVNEHRVLYSTASHPSPRAMSAGARAWRERNNRPPSRGVDFRTGLSGHMALRSSHTHSHDNLRSYASASRMSSHSGLTVGPTPRRARVAAQPPSIPLLPAGDPGVPKTP